MGTVHARVRGPATRGLRDLWVGAAGDAVAAAARVALVRGLQGSEAGAERGRGSPPVAPQRWAAAGRVEEAAEMPPAGTAGFRAENGYSEEGRDLPKVT